MSSALSSWLGAAYPWLKAGHVIFVISWMAALLYLPRLFVYHCGATPGSELSETLKVMEGRLARAIMTPAMLASLVFGLAMLSAPGVLASAGAWLWLKLALVVVLLGLHVAMLRWLAAFRDDRNAHSSRFYRVANEAPTALMIGIVILVVVRPI